MRLLLCNPKNSQGTTHSRKGMYVPLGIVSIATILKNRFGDVVDITVYDEDVEDVDLHKFGNFDVIGFYSTTFNYRTCIYYATIAKEYGVVTLLGGPHASVLTNNIMLRQNCFDYLIRYEAEKPIAMLMERLIGNNVENLGDIPNLVYKRNGKIIASSSMLENDLDELPIPSREFIHFERYMENFKKIYKDKQNIRPGSIYSSKGCSWRDKTGGCVFCARLEQGVRFRSISQLWDEVTMLKNNYKVNSIWDISDDNLNNLEWFKNFVKSRPSDCDDLSFFIYSRVNFINDKVVDYMKELNVEEVFLGVESGDDSILKGAYKGQTVKTILRAVTTLKENNIKYFPSFILGLPGETEESMKNTQKLSQELSDIGGLDRIGCTILQPIPGSKAYSQILNETEFGQKLKSMDDVDIFHLERFWVNNFTKSNYETMVEYRKRINETMKGIHVFGGENEN